MCLFVVFQGSAESNCSQPSSELSLDDDKEALRREKEAQALSQLDKARVCMPDEHSRMSILEANVL